MGGACGLVVCGGSLAVHGAVGSAVKPQKAAGVGSYVWLRNAGVLPSTAVCSTPVRPHWGCTAFFCDASSPGWHWAVGHCNMLLITSRIRCEPLQS